VIVVGADTEPLIKSDKMNLEGRTRLLLFTVIVCFL